MMNKGRNVFLPALFLVFITECLAQPDLPDRSKLDSLDSWINNYMLENNIPGCLIAVASKGKILDIRTYGMANVELDVPVTDTTIFEIGSVSKQFIAASTLLLCEKQKLSLNDQIQKFIPDIPGEWYGITIEQLIRHISGIPDYEIIAGYDFYGSRKTLQDIINVAHSRPVDFAPGTGWNYSNTGYYLLSIILERIENKPLDCILDSLLFRPIRMYSTRLADPDDIICGRSSGYWVDKSGNLINRRATETSSTLGAGAMVSTASDLALWDNALRSEEILTDKQKKEMWSETVLPVGKKTGYAMGWAVSPYMGIKRHYHGGQVAGFVTHFTRLPDQNMSIIVFANMHQVSSFKICRAVMHRWIHELGDIPK